MHKLHLFPWAILAPFLSTGLAAPAANSTQPSIINKTVSACAASPTEFDSLAFEFWIEAVPFGSVDAAENDFYSPREDSPLRLDRNFVPFWKFCDNSYSRVIVAQRLGIRDLFVLRYSTITNSDVNPGQLWPYLQTTAERYSGWYPFAFDVKSIITSNILLYFRAVEVCSSTGDLELELRARLNEFGSGRMFVLPSPFVCVLKTGILN